MDKSDLKGLWMPSEILINNKLIGQRENNIIYDYIFK